MKTMTLPTRPARGRGTSPAAVALILLGLTGCAQLDPLTRPYSWEPEQVNARNIAAMAVRPADLIQGRSTSARRTTRDETKGVERLWTGKPAPLLGGGGAGGGGGDSGGGGGAGGGTPGAGS